MQFTRLRLNGFKSFVDPTEMVIADGLTGVVGPNGCGKSNLLEALRWVMGENRPTAMRGDGMEDVIFAGTNRRPPRNFAEVALSIDNGERLAPAGFNDADMLEIARRITRDAGSAYKVNARDVRARDVQMLFADASTGAQSPALVRQGQISELINAKPRARRRILEEAAGISGLYQRRHEAELKLRGAETNLLRVDDVIEQLAAQLAQLVRQARQAARYRALGEELRQVEGLLLWRRWTEAEAARQEAEADLRARITAASGAERAARQAEAVRATREAEMPAAREEATIAAAVLQRLMVERDALAAETARAEGAIRALDARAAQLGLDRAREEQLDRDAGDTIRRLSDEAARLSAEDEGQDDRRAGAEVAARDAATNLQEREADFARQAEDVARLAARHQSAQRMLDDARALVERAERGAAEADAAASGQAQAEAEAIGARDRARGDLDAATERAAAAETALARADEVRAAAQVQEAEARAARSGADGELAALRAEVAALGRLVERDTAEGGQVLDLLRVRPGFENALGAALADDLRAPVAAEDGMTGWATLPAYPEPPPLPEGAEPLAAQVTAPEVMSRRMSQIGLVGRAQGPGLQAALRPGQRLVSVEGDLWRWDGLRAGADDAPSAAALRLQQVNRLETLKQDLGRAVAQSEGASRAHEHLQRKLVEASEADASARAALRDSDRAVAEATRALSRAEAECSLLAGKVEARRLAARRYRDDATEARGRAVAAEGALAALDDLDAARAAAEERRVAAEAARMTLMTRRAEADEVRRDGEDRARRLQTILRDRESWTARAATAGLRIRELDERRRTAEADLAAARVRPDEIARRLGALRDRIGDAETRRAAADDALAERDALLRAAVDAERAAEREASAARELRAATEARATSQREAVAQAAQRIRDELETTPEALREAIGADPGTSAADLETDVARIKRQRDALGPVNLRAEDDAAELRAEHDTLTTEKADLESAIRTLRSGIGSLNREGRERLLTAFEQVNGNFALLFRHLFGGGEAKLVMVESDDPLEAGLEIMCQPPGKRLSSLSLLSGGEQTLTALALIFAVFLANPAPICVLDEVDAPLDDANVGRFCDLLDEMTRRGDTRFLIITHHAVTMARMDRLFGVTMGEQGVSQLVSVDLRKAETLVA